mgnify:CR=1 FL=1
MSLDLKNETSWADLMKKASESKENDNKIRQMLFSGTWFGELPPELIDFLLVRPPK